MYIYIYIYIYIHTYIERGVLGPAQIGICVVRADWKLSWGNPLQWEIPRKGKSHVKRDRT